MIPDKYLHMDKIISPPPSVFGFDIYFCFTDCLISCTDLIIFPVPIWLRVMIHGMYLNLDWTVLTASFYTDSAYIFSSLTL